MTAHPYRVGDRVFVTRAHHWKQQGWASVTCVEDRKIDVVLDTGRRYFVRFDEDGEVDGYRYTVGPLDFDILGHRQRVHRQSRPSRASLQHS